MNDWQRRARAMTVALAEERWVHDRDWADVFAATPRHLFIPRFWRVGDDGQPTALIEGDNPAHAAEWLDAVYADRALIIEWTGPEGHRTPVSSASMPGVIALMLEALDLRSGDRVLEIGTGTGYNTALMCTRGAEVTSIDIEAELVDAARGRLDALGHHPRLVAGDGAAGYVDAAPYDRIIVTCSAPDIPTAWIEQLSPGGRIVSPMNFGGALAVVDKVAPDRVSGPFDPMPVGFVPLRSGSTPPEAVDPGPGPVPVGDAPTARVDPELDLAAFGDSDFRLWLSLAVPGCHLEWVRHTGGRRSGVVIEVGGAQTVIDFGEQAVYGSAALYDRVETTWLAFRDHGRPPRWRLGLTAHTSGQQYAWLDTPDSPVRWPVPG
ncbi:MAG TPA: methyltransferase domain-containing protein [Micromonosporaceae bacterium]|nr:methyltransferase domain-containing protein [Micromonosporaceae bacterium]